MPPSVFTLTPTNFGDLQLHHDHHHNDLQVAATEEKTKLEVAQREALKDRQSRGEDWQTKLFLHDVTFQNI